MAAGGSISLAVDGKCLCHLVVGNALGKCQFVVDARQLPMLLVP